MGRATQGLRVLQVAREPAERLAVPNLLHNAAHEDFHGPRRAVGRLALLASRHTVDPETRDELILRHCLREVDLVAKDHERRLLELLSAEQLVEFHLRLVDAAFVGGVNNENDAVDLGEVVRPKPASLRMASHVDCLQLDATELELFDVRMVRRAMGVDLIGGQLPEERGFPSVVKTEEKNLPSFSGEPEGTHQIPEPGEPPHRARALASQ
mmetsp:Transcript_23679/g.73377  ORF Transcript_23679/g.73377 Transcript_23679/m.73377 type:complete len:211 (+) Transcript_23679:43-675(+)